MEKYICDKCGFINELEAISSKYNMYLGYDRSNFSVVLRDMSLNEILEYISFWEKDFKYEKGLT